MSEPGLMDITGRMRSPAATPGRLAGCVPPNKGPRYPADPPTVEEIILVVREAGPGPYADRTRGPIGILWRARLRISDALALTETNLDPKTGSVLLRVGKGGKRRIVGMDEWALGPRRPVDRAPDPAARRSAVLHPRGSHPRSHLVRDRCPRRASPAGGPGWCAAAVRAAPAPACSCDRDGARRHPATDHPEGTSGMPTSGSPRSTSMGSTHARSSTRSTTADRQSFRRAQACGHNEDQRGRSSPAHGGGKIALASWMQHRSGRDSGSWAVATRPFRVRSAPILLYASSPS
jgi:hypothetical protein